METSRVKKKVVCPYLPVEVLSHIFEYLPYIDRKNASLVCQHWYNASLDHKFIAKECIYFDHISYLPNKLDILNLFINSARIYHRIVIKDCEINSNEWIELFEKYAPHFHFLCIDRCDINEKMFVQVIEILRELRKLEVHCCNQLLMSGLLFDSHPNISELKLSHCDQLELVSNRYISDHLIHRFFSLTHHIRHISLKNTNISFHRGLYKRFYPSRLATSGLPERPSNGLPLIDDHFGSREYIVDSASNGENDPVSLNNNVPSNTNNAPSMNSLNSSPNASRNASNPSINFASNDTHAISENCRARCEQNRCGSEENRTQCEENQRISEENRRSSDVNRTQSGENQCSSEETRTQCEETRNQCEETRSQCEENQRISEQTRTEGEGNRRISGETRSCPVPRYRSETVLTFVNILDFISLNAATLVSLDLSLTLIDNESLSQLATVEGLRLRELRLVSCDQVSNEGFVQLFRHQPDLLRLDLSSCSRLTDLSVLALVSSCTRLQSLRVRNCAGLTDVSARDLNRVLSSLQHVDISHCNQITGAGLAQMFASPAPHLHSLILSGLNLTPALFLPLPSQCTQIRVLDLSYCFTTVTDETLGAVFRHCPCLTELSLVSCDAVTDFGLMGLNRSEFEGSDNHQLSPIKSASLTNNNPSAHQPSNNPFVTHSNSSSDYPNPAAPPASTVSPKHGGAGFKMALGSRAEQDILLDARRKSEAFNLMRNMVPDQYSTMCEEEGRVMYGLNRVKGLTKLNLYGCTKITDVSLIYAFPHVPFLQHVDLSAIQQISSEGIRALCENNYRIQRLKLHCCFNLQDEDIDCITSRLKTLQSLDIANCVLLTDDCIRAVIRHEPPLKYLNLQKCGKISLAAINTLAAALPSLHTIISSSGGLVDEESPPIPPPPPLSRMGAMRR